MFRITSISDIAGQLTESSTSADKLTVAGVLLPSGGLTRIRKLIPREFPKWKNASDVDVDTVISIAIRESLSISAASVDKTAPQWSSFWQDAADVHTAVASMEKMSIGFLKAATLIKIILFGNASAACLGHAVRIKAIPDAVRNRGVLRTSEDVIIDNEIHGQDNREALVECWRAINSYQPLSNSMGLERMAKTLQLKTEQSEPLLLLSDYVAGAVHASNSHADTLSKSHVSPQAVQKAVLKLRSSRHFTEYSDTIKLDYFQIYPDFKRFSRRSAA